MSTTLESLHAFFTSSPENGDSIARPLVRVPLRRCRDRQHFSSEKQSLVIGEVRS